MAVTLQLPKIVKENFPSDQLYTYGALVEELRLMARHIRDGSWRLCSCNPEKHLPLVAGLGAEGHGFTNDPDEKRFMERMMSQARVFKAGIKKGRIRTQEDMDEIRAWARALSHRIEARDWRGKKDLSEQMRYDDAPESVKGLVDELEGSNLLTENPLSLPDLEERSARDMVEFLSDKHGVSPPREIKFTDRCNPLAPNAAHIQRDQLIKGRIVPRPDMDTLVFCRGGVTAFAVAHEFKHYLDHVRGKVVADEGKANRFAFKESRNNLHKGRIQGYEDNKPFIYESSNNLHGKGMAIDTELGLKVGIGLLAAKLVDRYDYWWEAQFPGYAQSAKAVAGLLLAYLGLEKNGRLGKGYIKDIALFAGMELVLSEVLKMFPLLGGPPAARAVAVVAPTGAVAIPGAPGRAVITSASPYTRMWTPPTRVTAGYPGVEQVNHKWIQVRV